MATLNSLYIVYSCFYTRRSELNGCNRDHIVCKAKYLLSSSLQKMFANPYFKPLSFGVVYRVAIEKWVRLIFRKRICLISY